MFKWPAAENGDRHLSAPVSLAEPGALGSLKVLQALPQAGDLWRLWHVSHGLVTCGICGTFIPVSGAVSDARSDLGTWSPGVCVAIS